MVWKQKTHRIKENIVNPRYNDSICSRRHCHKSEFAAAQNI